MRYDPRRRIEFPDLEDAKLWKVIEDEGYTLKKIVRIAPLEAKKPENWYATAGIEYAPGKTGIVDFIEFRKLGQSSQEIINALSQNRVRKRRAAWKKAGFPILLVSRHDSSQLLSWRIRTWVKKLQKELEEENG